MEKAIMFLLFLKWTLPLETVQMIHLAIYYRLLSPDLEDDHHESRQDDVEEDCEHKEDTSQEAWQDTQVPGSKVQGGQTSRHRSGDQCPLHDVSICHLVSWDKTISVTANLDKNQTDVEIVTHSTQDPAHSCCFEAEPVRERGPGYQNSRQPFTLTSFEKNKRTRFFARFWC